MAVDGAKKILPVVSVVIPTFRHRDLVVTTLESVWAQTFTDYEIIVVNDGSPDDTDAVLKPIWDAGRIRYIAQANGGQAAARNRGIAEAKGEFIALLDDDDLWLPDKLDWQVEALRAHSEVAVVYGRAQPIDHAGKDTVPLDEQGNPLTLPWETPTGWVYTAFVRQNWILSPGQCLIRRSALDSIAEPAPFDPEPALRGCDDWDLWCRLAERNMFLFQDRVALRYRFHAANASRDVLQMHRSTLYLCRKHLNRAARLGTNPVSTEERQKLLASAYTQAKAWSAHGLMVQAHHLYRQSGAQKDAATALAASHLLHFLAKTQPRFAMRPRFLWLLTRIYRNALRFRQNAQSVAAAAE